MPTGYDYLLLIDGIKGESKDDRHPDSIEIDSFSFGVSNSGAAAGGGGGGAGKASFQDISFTTRVSKATPLLMQACATGQHIKKATLFGRKAGSDQQEYYTVTLGDALVSSYVQGGSNGAEAVPQDSFSMNFSKIEIVYLPQNADGSFGDPVRFGFDRNAGRPS
jgi:type VI secretion system secreted protein Hcp